jgi:hypothetical protein
MVSTYVCVCLSETRRERRGGKGGAREKTRGARRGEKEITLLHYGMIDMAWGGHAVNLILRHRMGGNELHAAKCFGHPKHHIVIGALSIILSSYWHT